MTRREREKAYMESVSFVILGIRIRERFSVFCRTIMGVC